ncbi:MAG: hypothetical protein JSV51_03215 [Candidatus Bathyarchaeota archaeon]|nr:MAG: hypothetical protein JSV51_03215 [Candidatus Bathyarchaeota archaeon]
MRLNTTIPDEGNSPPSNLEMSDKLTECEKKVYDFIKGRREILTSNIPFRIRGSGDGSAEGI